MGKQSLSTIQNCRRNGVAALFLLIGATACSPIKSKDHPAEVKAPAVSSSIPGDYIVEAASPQVLAHWEKDFTVQTLVAEDKTYLLRSKKGANDQSTFEKLKASPDFTMVGRNFIVHADDIPRDPQFLKLWGLKNFGQNSPHGLEGIENADIGATKAWDLTHGSNDIRVGIIDTGIDYNHPNLKDNIFENAAEKRGEPGKDNDGNGYPGDIHGWNFVSENRSGLSGGQLGDSDPMDDNGHGTHVAGTIGAVQNGTGVVGVNWKVKMMAIKFLDADGSGSTADEIRAVDYAAKMKLDVINASYGGGDKDEFVEKKMKALCKTGVLFVAAAGNDGENNDMGKHYPASYDADCILAVAATNNRDRLASFSNFGYETVGIAAPGVDILSTYPVALDLKEIGATGIRNPYRVFSGTSMATPHVTGAAALLAGYDSSLRHNPVALKARLMETVDILPQLASKVASGGRLNIFRALKNDRNVTDILAGTWKEDAYDLSTPHLPTVKLDQVWKIQKPGAKAIKLHVQEGRIDSEFDVLVLYDSLHREVMRLPTKLMDKWLPVVMGDTMYLKFSNAVVKVAATKLKTYASLQEVDWTVYKYCRKSIDEKYECAQGNFKESIFPNFTSEGYQFDRIGYLEGVQVPAPSAAQTAQNDTVGGGH